MSDPNINSKISNFFIDVENPSITSDDTQSNIYNKFLHEKSPTNMRPRSESNIPFKKKMNTVYKNYKISLNNLNLSKKSASYFKDNYKELSNKFLSMSIHILIMIIFELYFYFEFAVEIEKEKFMSKLNEIFIHLKEVQFNYIESIVIKKTIDEESSLVMEDIYKKYEERLHEQEDLLHNLLIKSIKMASGIGCIAFALCMNGMINKKIINWSSIIFDNVIMFLALGIFEYFFFMNIILKYDPVTDEEIKYTLASGFLNYVNNSLIYSNSSNIIIIT